MSFTIMKFLGIFAFFALFMGVFWVDASPVKAQQQPRLQYAKDNDGREIKDRDCTDFWEGISGKSNLPYRDVKCRCPINSCRLSNEQGKYSCILGSDNMGYYLGFDNDLLAYTDASAYAKMFGLDKEPLVSYWSEILKPDELPKYAEAIREEELVELARKSFYTDIFNANGTQAMIPAGSYCKLHPSDPNGVAYWYYPGYFYTLQGRDYFGELQSRGVIGSVAVGAACGSGTNERILFTDTDLFGNQVTGTKTFFGCLPNSTNGITAFLVRLITGLAIFVTLIIAGINLILIIGNPTNTDLIQKSRKRMFAAVTTLIGILFTITILNIVGIQIIGFGSDGIGGSVFRFFVGGN